MTAPKSAGLAIGGVLVAFTFAASAAPAGEERSMSSQTVVVTPKGTDAILANPHVGWQTFHRTADKDKRLPDWIPSTVHYARWGWGRFEPRPGQIDHAFLDGVLDETRRAGQTLALRVMCCSTTPGRPYHPNWLREIGGRVIQTRYHKGGALEIPDLDDPAVLGAHLDFIARLGKRYDGHPVVDHVDLGTVGWWGEWHMSSSDAKMPTPVNQKKIVDAYLGAFKKTPLVMLVGGRDMLAYAVRKGAGWRADCLGDMGGFSKTWCHMRMAYPKAVSDAGAREAWRTAPVAWETCWDMRKWVTEGWSLRYIFNYALALHGSQINNKSAPLPAGEHVRPEVERFLRRLGYRFVLERLEHAREARPGAGLAVAATWRNTGSAPCYRPYRLAYRLTGSDGHKVLFVSPTRVNTWMPGSVELFTEAFMRQPPDLPPGESVPTADTIPLPRDLPAGAYSLAVAVVAEKRPKPVVQLAIQGRADDGWYPLSTVHVTE